MPAALQAAADLRAGERRHGEEDIECQPAEEVRLERQHRRADQFDKGHRARVKVVPIGSRRKDLDGRQKAHAVHRGSEEVARNQIKIERVKNDVADGRIRDYARRDFKFRRMREMVSARTSSAAKVGPAPESAGQDNAIRPGRKSHWPPTQQRELEEPVY